MLHVMIIFWVLPNFSLFSVLRLSLNANAPRWVRCGTLIISNWYFSRGRFARVGSALPGWAWFVSYLIYNLRGYPLYRGAAALCNIPMVHTPHALLRTVIPAGTCLCNVTEAKASSVPLTHILTLPATKSFSAASTLRLMMAICVPPQAFRCIFIADSWS